jgi:hypothetical protein
VEKITICRLTGQRATQACRHGWTAGGVVLAGLTELPGTPAGDSVVGTSGRAAAAPARANVYDDYFPYGTAPSGPCEVHGGFGAPGVIGTTGGTADSGVGVVAASYLSAPSTAGSRLKKVIGADGRAVWVVR